ncbi:unnamed protein product [Pelagomonas calceolata]|uniref:Uncharacterized protein n=3 Tax=Pelagomonas calceolata TaxID=35677 RepID=A0A8J2SKW0_9STRA|nr:unnamed protein product [Pelagomonas calceolata]
MADDGVYSAADREAARRAELLRRQREDARRRDAQSRERTFVDSIIETVTVAFADSSGRTPQMGRPMTYDEVMRRSAPQRSACEFDSLSDEADDSDSGDERAVEPRRVSPPPSPKTYDEALRPPAVARIVDDHEDASTFASTLSDDASETTEEDPYHVAAPSPRRKPSALPENGVLPPALLPSVLRDEGEAARPRAAAPS